MLAEVAKLRRAPAFTLDQRARRVRDEHLPSVCRGGDARRQMDGQPDVVVPAPDGLTRVQAHPHPHRDPLRPPVRAERPLPRDRRGDGRPGAREHREEGVALGAQVQAAGVPYRRSEQPVVILQDGAVVRAQTLHQPGRALDVGEQEGDGARREVRTPVGHAYSMPWAFCTFPEKSTETAFHSVNSSSACGPASRWPLPVFLNPPNGSCTSAPIVGAFA